MGRRKKVISPNAHLYIRNPFYTLPDGRVIEKDEMIKIEGEWGGRFKFQEHVVRTDTGVEWIDCFETQKGMLCGWRSFKPERIKPMPRKRVKNNVKKS